MENELVSVVNNEIVVSSRDVAEHFGKRPSEVNRSIENLVVQNCATKRMFHEATHEYRGQEFRYYLMNRDGFALLVMGFTGKKALEWKLKYIEAFDSMEEQLKNLAPLDSYMIADPIERAKAWIKEEEKRIALADQVKELEPKAKFADSVSGSSTSIPVGDLAKMMKQNGVDIGQNKLFAWLRKNGWLMNTKDSWNMPTQKGMNMKLFEIKEMPCNDNLGYVHIYKKSVVTGKGQVYFLNKMLSVA